MMPRILLPSKIRKGTNIRFYVYGFIYNPEAGAFLS
jgi:hypothetical protein